MVTEGVRGSNKKSRDKKDRISALTQELLVDILSLLSLKEAARTSVLSKRWVDLWKYVTNLELDYGSMVNESLVERKTYIQLVSKVLAQHKGPKLNSLRICLRLTNTSNSDGDIEKWVECAISKGVERLDLEFNRASPEVDDDDSDFDEYVGYSMSMRLKCFYQSRVLLGLSNVQFFRALSLRYVHLTNKILHHLISCCCSLEKLVLDCCDGLVKVNVKATPLASSPLLPLKHLEILGCPYVKEIVIDAPNLVSFRCDSRIVDIQMENSPSLKEVDLQIHKRSRYYKEVGIAYVTSYDVVLRNQSKFVQLETLSFEMDFVKPWYFYSINEFPFLRELTVYIDSEGGDLSDEYYKMVPLINACPSLNRLSLKSTASFPANVCEANYLVSDGGELRPSITVLEMTGFGTYSSNHFLAYVKRNFVMLEKLIINQHKTDFAPLPPSFRTGNACSRLLSNSWFSEDDKRDNQAMLSSLLFLVFTTYMFRFTFTLVFVYILVPNRPIIAPKSELSRQYGIHPSMGCIIAL